MFVKNALYKYIRSKEVCFVVTGFIDETVTDITLKVDWYRLKDLRLLLDADTIKVNKKDLYKFFRLYRE